MNIHDQQIHDQMMAAAAQYAKAIAERKEEVLSAFVAKYGFEPDCFIMTQQGLDWFVRRRTDEEIAKANAVGFRYVEGLAKAYEELYKKHEELLANLQGSQFLEKT